MPSGPTGAASTPGAPPTAAATVVVGGGVVGLSVAAHLAELGHDDVVLLEADRLGSGSSAKPIGGFRAQFPEATEIALSLRSIEELHDFERRWGVDPGIDPCGYLLLIRSAEDLERWTAVTAVQRALGVDVELLDAAEAARRNPYLRADALLAAQWSPVGGTVHPDRMLAGWARSAAARGVRILERTPVLGIEEGRDGAVVRTATGSIRAATVVLATGAWSAEAGGWLGIDLPVSPVRRQLAMHRPEVPHERVPFTIDLATGAYFHSMGDDTTVFGRTDPAEAEGFHRGFDESWLPGYRDALRAFAPDIAELPADSGWAGLYEMTPDGCPLIGAVETDACRVVYAVGFSGHGVMLSPAAGAVVADLVLGRSPSVDVAPLAAGRFAGGAAMVEGASL